MTATIEADRGKPSIMESHRQSPQGPNREDPLLALRRQDHRFDEALVETTAAVAGITRLKQHLAGFEPLLGRTDMVRPVCCDRACSRASRARALVCPATPVTQMASAG